ncbi:MAG: arsenate reductase (glutaredoxin) [Paracoccus sp. (in: a-proteobacteria)]|nr:arsenate reductase (glutaredoxin) [Paracoccus sp. (in: a-proteobacteria)]
MTVTIYHNPQCSVSRHVLDALREAGIEPQIIEYLKSPPTLEELRDLVARTGLSPRELLREKESEYAELSLDDGSLTDDQILGAIAAHPKLLERPILVGGKAVMIARPKERVADFIAIEEGDAPQPL